jgi:adenylate cyclase
VLEYERRYAAAYDEFKQAIALDPSDSLSYFEMARSLVWNGRPAEAMRYLTTAMRIDPNYPANYLLILGFAQFNQNQFEAAATSLEAAARRDPGYGNTYLLLAASYGYLNRRPEAMTAIARYNQLNGGSPEKVMSAWNYDAFTDSTDADRLREGLRRAGVAEY